MRIKKPAKVNTRGNIAESDGSHSAFRANELKTPDSEVTPIKEFISLQQTIGNQAVQRLYNSGMLQEEFINGRHSDAGPQEAGKGVCTLEPHIRPQQNPSGLGALFIQREEGAATTTTATPGATGFNIATASWQEAIREASRLRQTGAAADQNTALSYYKHLIIRAAQNVPVPAPLATRTPTQADIRWSWNTSVDWAAITNPNRVDNHPTNYWQWLRFNPNVFNYSQTYAESIIAHEFDHAAHAKVLFNAWTSAGQTGSWDAFYQQHAQSWTEPAITVSSPGIVGALSGLPSTIQPSVIEFRAYVHQLTSYFHRLSCTEHDLLPKAVVLFYPLNIQNVPSAAIRDPQLDLAAARQELLDYFNRPPVQDATQRAYVKLLLAQGFKSALRLFRPSADQAQMTQDFNTIMQFSTPLSMVRMARRNYQPQP